jgi:formate/nitrite transporter FocA (FNT family)
VGLVNLAQSLYITITVMAALALTGIKLEQDLRGSVTLFMPLSYTVGFILIVLLGIFNWRDLTRWFPQKIRKGK